MRLGAVVLAAGASRRLGRAKQLERVDGETLVRRAARAALEAGFAPVHVVLGARSEAVSAALEGLAVAPIPNPAWEEGMASSIRAGVRGMDEATEGVLLLVCDQVALDTQVLERLRRAFEAAPDRPAACVYEGVAGVPAIFPPAWLPQLETLNGDTGARTLLRGTAVTEVPWPEGARDLDQ